MAGNRGQEGRDGGQENLTPGYMAWLSSYTYVICWIYVMYWGGRPDNLSFLFSGLILIEFVRRIYAELGSPYGASSRPR